MLAHDVPEGWRLAESQVSALNLAREPMSKRKTVFRENRLSYRQDSRLHNLSKASVGAQWLDVVDLAL